MVIALSRLLPFWSQIKLDNYGGTVELFFHTKEDFKRAEETLSTILDRNNGLIDTMSRCLLRKRRHREWESTSNWEEEEVEEIEETPVTIDIKKKPEQEITEFMLTNQHVEEENKN